MVLGRQTPPTPRMGSRRPAIFRRSLPFVQRTWSLRRIQLTDLLRRRLVRAQPVEKLRTGALVRQVRLRHGSAAVDRHRFLLSRRLEKRFRPVRSLLWNGHAILREPGRIMAANYAGSGGGPISQN